MLRESASLGDRKREGIRKERQIMREEKKRGVFSHNGPRQYQGTLMPCGGGTNIPIQKKGVKNMNKRNLKL